MFLAITLLPVSLQYIDNRLTLMLPQSLCFKNHTRDTLKNFTRFLYMDYWDKMRN